MIFFIVVVIISTDVNNAIFSKIEIERIDECELLLNCKELSLVQITRNIFPRVTFVKWPVYLSGLKLPTVCLQSKIKNLGRCNLICYFKPT